MLTTNDKLNVMYVDAGRGGGGVKKVEEPKKEEPKTSPSSNTLSYKPSYYSNIGSFKPSAAYTQAMAYTNSLLEKINAGKTSYSDKIDALMNQIENREKFSYDFNTDPLFQNALQGAMAAGQTAMQDTMGQAASLTGGYDSSYATSAANQTYNNFVKGAYDSLPDYYQLAKSAYDQEGQELYDRLGMYRTADDTEYSRITNAYGLNLANAESIYNKEYSNYWDTVNYNFKVQDANNDLAYKYASLAQNQRNADRDFDEKVRQYNLNLAEEQRQFDAKNNTSATAKTLDSNARKDLINMVQTYGAYANSKVWSYADDLVARGYDYDEVMATIEANTPVDEWQIRDNSGYYTNQFGNQKSLGLNGAPAITQKVKELKLYSGKKGKEGSQYMDEYGNLYSYEQVKAWNLTDKITK